MRDDVPSMLDREQLWELVANGHTVVLPCRDREQARRLRRRLHVELQRMRRSENLRNVTITRNIGDKRRVMVKRTDLEDKDV